ncbi:MAG: Xaa-Pro peptidase family protein [Planctomycetota bacterium]
MMESDSNKRFRCGFSRALALLVLAGMAPAQAPSATLREVCGLGSQFHAGRRRALCAALQSGLLVLRGLPDTRTNTRFSQDKTFWYFTGVESANAALVVDVASGKEVLFLPTPNPGGESWEGEKWDVGDTWVPGLTGIDDVRAISELGAVLAEMLPKAGNIAWTSLAAHITLAGSYDRAGPYDRRRARDPFDGRPSREQAFAEILRGKYGAEVKDITPHAYKLRRVKMPEELDALRRAATAGALAMCEAMRSTRPGLQESDLEAVLDLVHRRHGAQGPAYQAIVGAGRNSLILHYTANRDRLDAEQILLIDYAPEVDHYVSDITRTWPIGGKFTERQADLYDAVLAAQEAGIAAAKPGNGMADVERACRDEIRRRGFADLVRHGACHLVGMEVHDPGFVRGPLEPGTVFTIEPGLYDPESGIGVRIEDVVVITETGCDVLSAAAPKARDAIEAMIAERGLLDPHTDGDGK